MFLVHRLILVGLDVGIASRVGFHDFSVDFSTARGLIKEEYKDNGRNEASLRVGWTEGLCWCGPQLSTSSLSSGNF